MLAALVSGPPGLAGEQDLATAVKASYLPKFAPFVDWPDGAFPRPDSPLVICVMGKDPFGDILDRAVGGQSFAGHPIVVRRLASAAHDAACHIAFLGGAAAQPVPAEAKALHGAAILTVTDGGGDIGSVVDLRMTGNRVRFRIDDEAAAEDGLRISSKLLGLAVSVRPRKPAGSPP